MTTGPKAVPPPAVADKSPLQLEDALLAAQAEIHSIEKDAYNKFAGYWYTSAEKMTSECRKVLHKHGLTVSRRQWHVRMEQGYTIPLPVLVSEFTVVHIPSQTGEKRTAEYYIIEGKGKPMDKALSGALTTSLAYWLRDLLLIPRFDEEVDQEKPQAPVEPNEEKSKASLPPLSAKPKAHSDPTKMVEEIFTATKVQMATVSAWFQAHSYSEERAKAALPHLRGLGMDKVKAMIEQGAKK